MTTQATAENGAAQARPIAIGEQANTVLVIPSGCIDEPVCDTVRQQVPATCVLLDADAAVTYLRANPLDIIAVVLSGDGKSSVSVAILDSIKAVAPRVPIVFLDERESPDSELAIRRAGIHYYTHLAANSGEIAAVLTHLAQASGTGSGRPA